MESFDIARGEENDAYQAYIFVNVLDGYTKHW